LASCDGTNSVQSAPDWSAHWQARSSTASDVDEHAANLSGWHQTYDQLGTGSFTGHLHEAVAAGVQIFRECTSQRLRQRCEVWPSAIWCGITEVDDGSRLEGRQVGPSGVMASGSDGNFELVSPAGHAIVGFVVSRDVLAGYAPWLELPRDPAASWWRVDPAQRRAALAHARAILALAGAGVEVALRGAMLEVVAGLLATRSPEPRERGNASSRRRLLTQVQHRIEANPDRAPSVAELCAQLHVSRRTLQYAFEEEAGIGPLAYLRCVRLNGVRRLLRNPPPGLKVQTAAALWGFWNLSAFASDYRRQFGERASETLARALAQSPLPVPRPAAPA
jgi:AraC family transcriptional regulator, ethanolamine operon transcriptional activator